MLPLLAAALIATARAAGCDPLVAENCLLPFPNDYYRENGKVALTSDVLPKDTNGRPILPDFAGFNKLDGFPALSPIVTYIANASLEGCARFWNINASLAADSPTTLVTADGTRVPHWVELDHFDDGDESDGALPQRALLIWPAARLADNTTYHVGVAGLRARDDPSSVLPASAYFAGLRDRLDSAAPRAASLEPAFAALGRGGVTRAKLQMAWSFTTNTRESVTTPLVVARDDALARVAARGPQYKVLSVSDNPNSHIARHIEGTVLVPWYLNQVGAGPSARLVLDAAGKPVYQGMQPVNFTFLIPNSLANGSIPTSDGLIMHYGHGLFGSRHEVQTGYLAAQADERGYTLGATDWIGLSEADEVWVAYILGQDLSNFTAVPDRCVQGMVNALVATELYATGLAGDAVTAPLGRATVNPNRTVYYGNSQGGIIGGVYMAASTRVTRGVLGVAGGPYSLLLPRSVDFAPLGSILRQRYAQALDLSAVFVLLQMLWDRLEPAGFVNAISQEPLPGTPAHRVIVNYGLGDAQVTWLGAQALARSIGGAVMFESNVVEGNVTTFGFTHVPDSAVVQDASVLVGFDFGSPEVPFINVPASKKYDTHEDPRRTPASQAMMDGFFKTGGIANTCGGPCKFAPPPHVGDSPRPTLTPAVWEATLDAVRRGDLN